MNEPISFDDFRQQWLEEIKAGNPRSGEVGRRFAHKLFMQWRDITESSDDLIYCDGPGDGGIDLAYLERGEAEGDNLSGDVWYLVQSKYGTAFQGGMTLLQEAQKVMNTLEGNQQHLSSLSSNLWIRLDQFRRQADASDRGDRLVLVFATERPLSDADKRVLEDIRTIGRSRIGPIFDVEAVSIETIYLNTLDDSAAAGQTHLRIPMKAELVESGQNLLIGSVSLPHLYDFLRAYRSQTEDLDQLYEKNVRLFLGGRRRVNRGMQTTLQDEPEQFGLYNNGITVVVKDFNKSQDGSYELIEPYVVNGCQTTKTIWQVFHQKLEAGGHGHDLDLERWKTKAADGVVVTKIVRVGSDANNLLQNITRYTNSQNAVTEKDFVTLDQGFHHWKREMADKYDVFLEVQRGGWDSRQAFQKQNPMTQQFTRSANAFDLLKVYGSGWLREAGTAFGRNAAFVPGGPLYRKIVEEPFGVDDLYAAFNLQEAATHYGFGRGSRKKSRLQTRYLFYMVALDLMRDIMIRANLPTNPGNLTQALLNVFRASNQEARNDLMETAVGVIDEYLTQGEEDSVFTEPGFKSRNNDLNAFLKWEELGHDSATPNLSSLMAINKRTMGRGQPSPRELITSAIHATPAGS